MKSWGYILAFAVAALGGIVSFAEPSYAQATRTWVSGVGDDANPCSRTAPCKTFAGAISKTAAGGEINAIDPGGFGAVTITKSITIDTANTVGGVLNSSTNGVTVNAAATDVVVLRGLDIDSGTSSPGVNGVRFLAGGALHIEDSVIRGNGAAAPNGFGILFAPASGSPALFVNNSTITGNGVGTGGAGIQIIPTGSAGTKVTITNSVVDDNGIGIRAAASNTTGTVDLSISDTSTSGNVFYGVVAQGGSGTVRAMLERVVSSSNGSQGIRSTGANALIRMGSSVVTSNQTGVAAVNGGVIQSYGNNQIDGNVADGAAPPIIPLK